jgi:hypothetical protein
MSDIVELLVVHRPNHEAPSYSRSVRRRTLSRSRRNRNLMSFQHCTVLDDSRELTRASKLLGRPATAFVAKILVIGH